MPGAAGYARGVRTGLCCRQEAVASRRVSSAGRERSEAGLHGSWGRAVWRSETALGWHVLLRAPLLRLLAAGHEAALRATPRRSSRGQARRPRAKPHFLNVQGRPAPAGRGWVERWWQRRARWEVGDTLTAAPPAVRAAQRRLRRADRGQTRSRAGVGQAEEGVPEGPSVV